MSLLHELVCATACPSTHHRLAMDALLLLRCPDADGWRELFLNYYEPYLRGAKAPDDEFKDYKNHVLHVHENGWGGAIAAAQLWYERLVLALRKQYWSDAVFLAGVLSHYLTDTLMPLHTGQSEEAGRIHRAVEWSIAKSYDELREILEDDLGGFPPVILPEGRDWLPQLIRRNAELAHAHYQVFLDHYHLTKGVQDPPEGLDQELKDRTAALLGHAASTVARVLDRALVEGGSRPPMCELVVETILALAKWPYRSLRQCLEDGEEREYLEDILEEVQRTGKVIENLPEDDELVRKAHADQVLKITMKELDARPARPTGLHYGRGAPRRDVTPAATSWFGGASEEEARPLSMSASELLQKALEEANAAPRGSLSSVSGTSPVRWSGVARSVSLPTGRRRLARRGVARRVPTIARVATVPAKGDSSTHEEDSAVPVAEGPRVPMVRRTIEFRDDPPPRPTAIPPAPPPPADDDSHSYSDESDSPGEDQDHSETDRPEKVSRRRRVGQFFRGVASRVAAGYSATTERMKKLVRRRKRSDAAQGLVDSAGERHDEHAESQGDADDHGADSSGDSAGRSLKFHLDPDRPVEDAPSIGPKMAKRLEGCDVRTVADLLAAEPENVAAHLGIRAITAETVTQWQQQADLVCRVPNLRGHDAQLLVACGVTDVRELAAMDPGSLFELIEPFLRTREAEQILRGSPRPDLDEVADWIDWAHQAR